MGAKVDLVNRSGETPLHVAAERGLATLATALLVAGADPNIQVQCIVYMEYWQLLTLEPQ